MNRLRTCILNAARILAPALAFLVLPPSLAQAQMWGYGGYGYGFNSGYSYVYPGYAGVGVGYYNGIPAPAYGGPVGFGLGYGYGYPAYNYGYFANAYPGVRPPLGSAAGYPNPLFGMGLSPLGVQGTLNDAYLLGATRGRTITNPATQYYGTGSARPR